MTRVLLALLLSVTYVVVATVTYSCTFGFVTISDSYALVATVNDSFPLGVATVGDSLALLATVSDCYELVVLPVTRVLLALLLPVPLLHCCQ